MERQVDCQELTVGIALEQVTGNLIPMQNYRHRIKPTKVNSTKRNSGNVLMSEESAKQSVKSLECKQRLTTARTNRQKFALQQDLDRKSYLLQKQNAAYKDYCKQNGLRELQDRLMIAKWNRQNAAKARGAAKRYKTAKGID